MKRLTMFHHLAPIPSDEIFQLNIEYTNDERENKINGGIGVYFDDEGKPFVLPVVKKALSLLPYENFNYLPINGDPVFLTESARLVLGDTLYERSKNKIAHQGVNGGTNGLFLWGSLIKKNNKKPSIILSNPTWENHKKIFSYLGFKMIEYNHVNSHNEFDFDSCAHIILKYQHSHILFHGGPTHNPTGINPDKQQWKKFMQLIKKNNHSVLFDFAYMGLGENIDEDSYPIRLAVKNNVPTSIIISYSKNMTLYQHRTGALFMLGKTEKEKTIIESHLKYLFRIINSNPSAFGELIVKTILTHQELKKEWISSLKNMARSLYMRRKMFIENTGKKFSYLTRQKGLFSLLNLSPQTINNLKKKHAIYLLSNSRINFGGISIKNISKLARAVLNEMKKKLL